MIDIFFSENGWTDLISEGITFDNLAILGQSICDYFRREQNYIDNFPPRFAIGFDNRFLGEKYAQKLARIIINNGIDVYLSDRISSTPALFTSVKVLSLTAGIMITAGDLPYEYSGIKICDNDGSILNKKITDEIEEEINILDKEETNKFIVTPGQITEFNPKNYYFYKIKSIVDIPTIVRASIDITVDYMNSACSNYLKEFFIEHNYMIREINDKAKIDFGGLIPNLNNENISKLQQLVILPRSNLQVGFIIDGDGSKLKAVDISGNILSAEMIFCIILKHLTNLEDLKGGIIIPRDSSKTIDLYCKNNDININYIDFENFNEIPSLMKNTNSILASTLNDDFYFNMNEHILEKDGILASLILLEAMSIFNQNLNSIYNDIKKL